MSDDLSNYQLLHLHELESELNAIDEEKHPENVKEIRRLIAVGGYQYPTDAELGQRPLLISIMVIIGVAGSILSIPLVMSSYAKQIGVWYQVFLSLGIVFAFISHIGFWLMKKWSVYLYLSFFLVAQIILVSTGLWQVSSVVAPTIVAATVLYYISRMK